MLIFRVMDCLGSGYFGTVSKGVWQSQQGPVEVALKTLKSSATAIDRVKFLQEGAIMGQFNHCNVTKLYGIVKDDQTVSIYISNPLTCALATCMWSTRSSITQL